MAVVGAQFEQPRECWEEEQRHLEEQLFGCRHSHDHGKEPEELDLDQGEHQRDRQEGVHQLLTDLLF